MLCWREVDFPATGATAGLIYLHEVGADASTSHRSSGAHESQQRLGVPCVGSPQCAKVLLAQLVVVSALRRRSPSEGRASPFS